MKSPYRIIKPLSKKEMSLDNPRLNNTSFFIDRLLRLIPSDILGIYLIGGLIIPENIKVQLAWMFTNIILVIATRLIGTQNDEGEPQYATVVISTISFILWIYLIGNTFRELGLHIKWLAVILALLWTYIVPLIYRGDDK